MYTRRCRPFISALALAYYAVPAAAQYGGPIVINRPPGLTNLTGSKLIDGTEFPWVNRHGQSTKLGQGFSISYGHAASEVTVKLNGITCQVVQNSMNPSQGTWTHNAPSIAVGPGPSVFRFEIRYFDSAGAPIPQERGGVLDIPVHVYKVDPIGHDDTVDHVAVSSNLEYSPDLLQTPAPAPFYTRQIQEFYQVRAPQEAMNDFTGLYVGLIQTIPTAQLGTTLYSRYPDPYTLAYADWLPGNPAPLPLTDAAALFNPWYASQARHDLGDSRYGSASDNVWLPNELIILVDRPSESTPPHIGPPGDPVTYIWGQFSGTNRIRDGVPTVVTFEDTLVAWSMSCQNVYVPITIKNGWRVTFSGYQDTTVGGPNYRWVGGSVVLLESPYLKPATLGPYGKPHVDALRQ